MTADPLPTTARGPSLAPTPAGAAASARLAPADHGAFDGDPQGQRRSRPSQGRSDVTAQVKLQPCNMLAMERLPVISLFSGAGGLDLAVEHCLQEPGTRPGQQDEHEPLRVAVALDCEPDAAATLRRNFACPVLEENILRTSTTTILKAGTLAPGDAALVVGGPPCTPFSKSGFWLDYKRESRDANASLLDEYARVVEEAKPEAFVLENVQGLTYHTHAAQLDRLVRRLRAVGYNPRWQVLNAAAYGVPQLRKRVFIVGRRDGLPFRFPEPTHSGWTEHSRDVDPSKEPFVTAGEVLKDLLPGEPEPGEVVSGQFADLAASVPPGQNYLWHSERGGGERAFRWRSRYWTFLLRLDPDRPATTLQAQPGPWVGPFHWENVVDEAGRDRARRLRVPEMLRLMTFPDGYKLVGDRRSIQRQLGNAVPFQLGRVVVCALLEQLGYIEQSPGMAGGQLELL
jgi:DNA (cytosine-5)-methyltransferase 1